MTVLELAGLSSEPTTKICKSVSELMNYLLESVFLRVIIQGGKSGRLGGAYISASLQKGSIPSHPTKVCIIRKYGRVTQWLECLPYKQEVRRFDPCHAHHLTETSCYGIFPYGEELVGEITWTRNSSSIR